MLAHRFNALGGKEPEYEPTVAQRHAFTRNMVEWDLQQVSSHLRSGLSDKEILMRLRRLLCNEPKVQTAEWRQSTHDALDESDEVFQHMHFCDELRYFVFACLDESLPPYVHEHTLLEKVHAALDRQTQWRWN